MSRAFSNVYIRLLNIVFELSFVGRLQAEAELANPVKLQMLLKQM